MLMSAKEPYNLNLGLITCSTISISRLLDEVRLLLSDRHLSPRTLFCLNAHIYNIAHRDADLRRILNAARVVSADGMAIVWVSRLFGARIPERCNATEAFRTFLQARNVPSSRAIIVGMSESEVRSAAGSMEKMSTHCRIVEAIPGFLSDADYRMIFSSHTDIDFILLGMGTPKTERIAEIASEASPRAIIWHIGAGTIRILAGTMKEAPVFWRRTGLQWLHRLYCDPVNLWSRYLIGNPLFICRIVWARLRGCRLAASSKISMRQKDKTGT